MCVISANITERITPEQVAKMYADNPSGAGIAWREWTDKKGNQMEIPPDPLEAIKAAKLASDLVVVWKKGLDLNEVQELVAKVPLPFVVHFRVPSCGGPSEYLTHPFPITPEVELELEGSTQSSVLFHNGHWNPYKEQVRDVAAKGAFRIPTGKWSDSRALAWMAHHLGAGILEFINEKVCMFGPKPGEIELFGEFQWTRISNNGSKEGGIYVSNMGWEHKKVTGFVARQVFGNEKKDDTKGGDATDTEGPRQIVGDVKPPGQKAKPGTTIGVLGSNTSSSTGSGGGKTGNQTADDGGGSSEKGPFDFYHAAVRLWRKDKISKKSLKRSRKQYVSLCGKMRVRPDDWPLKNPNNDGLSDPRLETIH